MSIYFRPILCVIFVCLATTLTQAQDFSQFDTAHAVEESAAEDTKAVYASLSDVSSSEYDDEQVAFDSTIETAVTGGISDAAVAEAPKREMSILTAEVSDRGVEQDSLLDPEIAAGQTFSSQTYGIGGDIAYGLPSACECGAGSSCDALGGCDTCCTIQCGQLCTRECPTCCGVGTHYSRVYAEALYLRARNAEVAYAVPIDGPIAAGLPAPIQVGNIGIVDSDYELGFRVGINVALDTISSFDVRYTLFESLTEDETSAVAPLVVRSLVTHPSTASASQDALSSLASLEIDFDMIDASYRHLWKCDGLFAANYVVGARYAKLEQQFNVHFLKNGIETVSTDIDFDGAGLRLGLETERYSCRNKLHIYANGYASFLAGRFRAHYFQGQSFDPTVVNAEWEAGRIVPILDLEAGVGWSSKCDKLHISAGYLVSAWFNTVTTQEYVDAIQTNSYLDLNESIWFDGLQARVQLRF